MKRIIAFLALAALSLPLYSQTSECTPPPMRPPIPQVDLEKYIDKMLNGTGMGEGSAKEMFDQLDKEYDLSKGLIKVMIGGQEVYMEPKEFLSELQAKRRDESEPKDAWFKGDGSRDQEKIEIKPDGKVIIYNESVNKKKNGVFMTSHLFKSRMTDNPQDGEREDECGSGGFEIKYEPLKIKVKEPQKLADVYVGGNGAVQLKVTDYLERWCLDGYKFKVTVTNPEVMSAPSEVTSNSTGNALVVIKGLKEGESKLKITLDLTDEVTGETLKFDFEMSITVRPPEHWSYSMHVYDAMLEPAQEYDMWGKFEVIQTFNEEDYQVHWHCQNFSPATKSGGASYEVVGGFVDELNREKGIVMGYNLKQAEMTAKEAEKQMKQTMKKFRKDVMRYVMSSLRNTTEVYDYIGSDNPICCIIAPLNEGSKRFAFNGSEMMSMAGFDTNVAAGQGMQEPQMDPSMTEDEYRQKMVEGMKDYINAGNIVAIPDYTKMLFVHFGNVLLTEYVAMFKVAAGASEKQIMEETMAMKGKLTFTREDN